MSCTNCGSMTHERWACTKPPKESAGQLGVRAKDVRVTTARVQVAASQTKSTAARKDVQSVEPEHSDDASSDGTRGLGTMEADRAQLRLGAGTQAPPVDTKPRSADRHRPGYFAEYQRKRRAKDKQKG